MSAAEKFIHDHGYEGIVELIHGLPLTWLPALTIEMVEEGYRRPVWRDGGASKMIVGVEKSIADFASERKP